jgi:hypothetical protein
MGTICLDRPTRSVGGERPDGIYQMPVLRASSTGRRKSVDQECRLHESALQRHVQGSRVPHALGAVVESRVPLRHRLRFVHAVSVDVGKLELGFSLPGMNKKSEAMNGLAFKLFPASPVPGEDSARHMRPHRMPGRS